MRVKRVLGALVTSYFFGVGGGLAALGEWQRAAAWLASVPMIALLGVTTMPLALLAIPIVYVASGVHAVSRAVGTSSRMRALHWMPWACFCANIAVALLLRMFVVEAYKMPSSSMYPALHTTDHLWVDKLSKYFGSWQRGDIVVFVYPCDPSRDYIKRVIGLPGDTVEVRCNVVHVNGKPVANELVDGPTCTYEDQEETSGRWFEKRCSRYRETLDGRTWDVFHNDDRPAHDALWRHGALTTGDARDFPARSTPFPPSCSDTYDGGGAAATTQVKGKLVETKPETGTGPCEPQLHYVVPDDHLFVLGDNRDNSNDSRIWGAVPVASVKGRAIAIWWSEHESGRIGSLR